MSHTQQPAQHADDVVIPKLLLRDWIVMLQGVKKQVAGRSGCALAYEYSRSIQKQLTVWAEQSDGRETPAPLSKEES